MLTISLDRVFDLLETASQVEVAEPAAATDSGMPAFAGLDLVLADDPAYREMMALLDALEADEIYELLALGLLARNAAALDEWQAMVEQAHAVPQESLFDELIPMLLLTDEIELALERLGYSVDEGEEDEDEEEDEEEEEEEQGEDGEDGGD
jgi:hypothetical protein